MKHSSIVLLFLLIVAINVIVVKGEYSLDLYPLQNGASDSLGADSTISFFELPLWIQLTWIIGLVIGIFGVIKFGAAILGKVKIKLQNKNRAAILNYIGINPGCTLADLSKNTGVNRGTAKYHLYLLLVEREVVRDKYGKLSYLFLNGGNHLEKRRVYGYVMNPAKRDILNTIFKQPSISNKKIAAKLQFDPSTIHWHLQQFIEEKMIVSHWDGRNMNYILLPEVEAIMREYGKHDA